MGEEQEEVTGYLGVVLARRRAAGGVLSTGAVHGGGRRRRVAALRCVAGDGAAMGGFSKAGWSGGARRRDTEARARGLRRVAACRQRHGSGTSAETMRTCKNEESTSISESRGVNFYT